MPPSRQPRQRPPRDPHRSGSKAPQLAAATSQRCRTASRLTDCRRACPWSCRRRTSPTPSRASRCSVPSSGKSLGRRRWPTARRWGQHRRQRPPQPSRRHSRTTADRGRRPQVRSGASSGGSNSAVPNGSGAMGARALNGGSPGSAQQQPGAAGGGMPSASRKSSSYSSLPFGDPPAACVLGAAPPATMCESHACYAPRALLKGNVVQLVYLSPSYKFRWSTCGQLSSTLDRQHDAIALYMHVNVTSGTVFASR